MTESDNKLLLAIVGSFGELAPDRQERIMAALAVGNDSTKLVKVVEDTIITLGREGFTEEAIRLGIWKACSDLANSQSESGRIATERLRRDPSLRATG